MKNVKWIFDPLPPSESEGGGDPAEHVFDQDLDTFVREVLQNSKDQSLDNGQPVRVSFDFLELEGEKRDDFLKALGWNGLEPHLRGMVDAGWLSSERIQRELSEIEDHPQLRLLRITDSGTRGLTGGESEQKTNFKSLCRDVLTRPETGEGQGGGAFGLGKAVLWAFSGVATVIFFSELSISENEGSRRLFGRANLASHNTHGERRWLGQGFFGVPETREDTGQTRAVSAWDPPENVLVDLSMERLRSYGPGTSIMLIDFDEPDREEDRDLVEIAGQLRESVVKWFWPSLTDGSLVVDISVTVGAQKRYEEVVDEPDERVRPFVEAWNRSEEDCVETLENINDVSHVGVPVLVPPRVKNLTGPAEPGGHSTATLRLAAFPDDADISGKVALVRGPGMVVAYMNFPVPTDLGFSVCGVLRAGTVREDPDDGDRRLEAFLRAAEPPAHNMWTHKTRRVRADYPTGGWRTLTTLWEDMRAFIREAATSQIPPSSRPPDALMKLLRVGRRGVTPAEGKLNLGSVSSVLKDGVWQVDGSVSNTRKVENWEVVLSLILDEEGGKGVPLEIAQGTVDGKPAEPEDRTLRATIRGERAEFRLTSERVEDYEGILSQTRCLVVAQLVRRSERSAESAN